MINGINHITWSVDDALDLGKGDYDLAVAKLRRHRVIELQENVSEGESFYFLDPSGNKLELHCSTLEARIEDGKRKWHDAEWYI